MNSVIISWGLFLTFAGGVYWVYLSPKSAATKLHVKPIIEDKGAGGIFLNPSGTEGAEKKKRKKKKPTPSNTAPKDIISTDDGFKAAESTDDDDVAQEEDQAEVLRRLQSLREGSNIGGKKPASASSSTRQLAPQKAALAPASPFATASQTSSAGADADIDEEEATRLPGSDYVPQQTLSSDPSDMLESSTGGPGVLKITTSAQLPRPPKQKTTSTASQSGVHSNKNAKKKEKKKSEKDAEKADQKARFELHRATMRATEVAKQNSKPPQSVTPPSAWASNDQAPSTAPKSTTDGLLDTFAAPVAKSAPAATRQTTTDSEEEKQQMRSTHLGDSYWEEIPDHLIGGWNEVQKKGRKQKKAAGEVQTGDESTDARSGKEGLLNKATARVLNRAPSKPVVQKKVTPAGGNGFQLLDTGSTTSNTNNSSSDWAEVDDLDNWAVHPEE